MCVLNGTSAVQLICRPPITWAHRCRRIHIHKHNHPHTLPVYNKTQDQHTHKHTHTHTHTLICKQRYPHFGITHTYTLNCKTTKSSPHIVFLSLLQRGI